MYNSWYGVGMDENGLYYMRARYYNVDIKRFINQDVLEGSIASSPSLNQYAYCQGNPVKLTDPFGLSPFISWSTLGHALLDALGFIPVIGAVPDTVNGLWYLAEGDHFSALASFVSAIPGWGDVAGAVGKTAKGCSRVSRMVRYGSKIVGRIGNIALGSYQTGSIAVSLYDKHIVQGESWDWDSTVQLFSAGLFATTTAVSVKGLKGDVGEYRRVVGEKKDITGTVWDKMKATQENYPNTVIPKSFEIEVNGEKMWVHGNATEHMYEDVYKRISIGNRTAYINPHLYTQELMGDFYGSLEMATYSGIKYGEKITKGNWEFIFSEPRKEGQLPVIKHSKFNGWH